MKIYRETLSLARAIESRLDLWGLEWFPRARENRKIIFFVRQDWEGGTIHFHNELISHRHRMTHGKRCANFGTLILGHRSLLPNTILSLWFVHNSQWCFEWRELPRNVLLLEKFTNCPINYCGRTMRTATNIEPTTMTLQWFVEAEHESSPNIAYYE